MGVHEPLGMHESVCWGYALFCRAMGYSMEREEADSCRRNGPTHGRRNLAHRASEH